MTKIATKRSEMTKGARETLDALDASLIEMFEVKSDTIPEEFRGKKEMTAFTLIANRMAKKIKEIDVDGISVKFDSQKRITEYTPQRLATINRYRDSVDNEDGIKYNEANDHLQYQAMVNFACQLAEWGWFDESDFETDD